MLRRIANDVGAGLFAGAADTAAMTASSSLEARLTGRGASSAPADAAGKVLGVQPRDPEGAARFSTVVHWSYGTAWGAARGLIVGGPPPWQQTPQALATDAFHHLVY